MNVFMALPRVRWRSFPYKRRISIASADSSE
jgi:hypothetical protein